MTTKKFTLLAIMAVLMTAAPVLAQRITAPRTASPAAEVTQTIGISTISITYSRPSVRDREVWGTNLAHYGYQNLGFGSATAAPWRAGANENTVITFSDDAMVEGKSIPAGSYGLFMGLYEDGKADVIFSKNSGAWGSYFYDESQDQLRVSVTSIETSPTERLTYDFVDLDKTTATVVLDWEKKRIPFKVSFNVDDIVMANAANELQNVAGFAWTGPASAAQYSMANDVELEKGLAWADASIGIQKNFNNMSLKAQILNKLGKKDEATVVMDEAIKLPSASALQLHAYGRQLIAGGDKAKALEIFLYNNKENAGAWPTNYGLARGYSANGDYKKALKYLKIALTKVPANDTQNPPLIEANIKKLEKGEDIN